MLTYCPLNCGAPRFTIEIFRFCCWIEDNGPGLLDALPTKFGGLILKPLIGSPLFEIPPTGNPDICAAPTALLLEFEVNSI